MLWIILAISIGALLDMDVRILRAATRLTTKTYRQFVPVKHKDRTS
ncbi:hypothetical protein [Roseibium polysiphoniae]|uniref:Uncharacterized protein n=1 Tax=Roseibium polysiphoniae TaxID=2571221 RepID=A0ABR9C9D8_9HYPH|nr:hypothetical protein [Roseibium polysiphoniae]MBD8876505.1 hypothetical protein [Roseibium polysiphoniae]